MLKNVLARGNPEYCTWQRDTPAGNHWRTVSSTCSGLAESLCGDACSKSAS